MPIRDKILDRLNCTILCLDADTRVRYLNSTGEMMFESSAAVVQGQYFAQLLSLIEYNSIIDQVHNFSDSHQTITEHQARITLVNGHSMIVDYNIYALDPYQHCGQLVIEIRPLDRQVEIEKESLRDTQKQLSQQFARGIAHEIKNPLGGIRGAAQLLGEKIPQGDLCEYTDIIISEVDRLQVLIDQISVPESRLEKKPVNILEILEHIYKLLETAEPYLFQFHRDYDPSIPEFFADRGLLIQAFLNIALNAVQALTGDGEITFKTRIDRKFTIGKITHPLVVQVDIIDTGSGIADAVRDTLFLPMVTHKAEGSGLGLAIAQAIISRHGGIIKSASSTTGTCFTTILPLER